MAAAGGGGGELYQPNIESTIFRSLTEGYAFYAITHGAYYDVKKAVVPDNTLLFIAQTPGDYCLLSLNNPMWWLLQPETRDIMLAVMYGKKFTNDQDMRCIMSRESIAEALLQYSLYIPGNSYLDRTLQIGEGEDMHNPFSSENQMGFYGFGKPAPMTPYGPGMPANHKYYSAYVVHGEDANTVLDGAPVILPNVRRALADNISHSIRVSEFISLLPPAATPRIVFITSCGIVSHAPSPRSTKVTEYFQKKLKRAINEEGGLGYRNVMQYFPNLYHSAPTLKRILPDPSNPNMAASSQYPVSLYRAAQTKGGARLTQKVKHRRHRRTRRQR